MVWTIYEPTSRKTKYVTKVGNAVIPTDERSKGLNEIPEGWELNRDAYEKTGRVRFRPKK